MKTSPLTKQAILYTWRQLAQRIGLISDHPNGTGFESLNIPICYNHPEQCPAKLPALIIVPAAPEVWPKLLSLSPHRLHRLSRVNTLPPDVTFPFVDDSIPVLFWGASYEDGHKPFAEQLPNGSIVFYADIIAATFFMLSRWEEMVVPIRDEHDRFPATASVAYKQGFLDRPIVDEYALILRAWLKIMRPGWEPNVHPFSVKLSHDIDRIRYFRNWNEVVRTFGGDLLKRRSLRCAWQTCVEAVTQTLTPHQTANYQGIYTLAELSSRYGLDSCFYFMTTNPDPLENDYDLTSPLMSQVIETLRAQRFEIGLHPGYRTLNDQERLAAEKSRLDAILGEVDYGGRQHFLRFQVPDTWRHWEQVGLSYDSTLTYADCEGFRCGTCHPYHPFNIEQNRELSLQEWPLIIMDKTLTDYRGLTPEQGKLRILELAQKCKQVEGIFTLLWHNSSLDDHQGTWGDVYRRVLIALAEMQGRHERSHVPDMEKISGVL